MIVLLSISFAVEHYLHCFNSSLAKTILNIGRKKQFEYRGEEIEIFREIEEQLHLRSEKTKDEII